MIKQTEMPDLIMHIGYPKCASSFLQNVVFKPLPNYLGAQRGRSQYEDFARQFKMLSPLGTRVRGNLKKTQDWTNNVLEYKKPFNNSYLLSAEGLSLQNVFTGELITPFLLDFSKKVWKTGQIKILVIIRNQAERVASLYSQLSIRKYGANQEDFEKLAMKYIKKDTASFKYHHLIEGLITNFGRENVCVLPLEEIDSLIFWEELSAFIGQDVKHFYNSKSDLNKRSVGINTWEIRNFSGKVKGERMAEYLFTMFWPYFILPKLRNKILHKTNQFFEFIYLHHPKNRLNKRRETQIVLSKSLRLKIQKECDSSNKKLSKLINKDLFKLGY